MADLVAIPLPDGRWIGLPAEALQEALTRGAALGLAGSVATAPTTVAERWLTSDDLQAATGIHSTTWEAKAKTGEVPCLRVGKALRFKLTEVEAAIKARTKG